MADARSSKVCWCPSWRMRRGRWILYQVRGEKRKKHWLAVTPCNANRRSCGKAPEAGRGVECLRGGISLLDAEKQANDRFGAQCAVGQVGQGGQDAGSGGWHRSGARGPGLSVAVRVVGCAREVRVVVVRRG